MPPINNRSIIAIVVSQFLAISLLHSTVHAAVATPSCQSLGTAWYFPNDCVADCNTKFGSSTMDTDRSRNVNGKQKCYCVGEEVPHCTDDPLCSNLLIFPGTALEDCQEVCSADGAEGIDVTVLDDVEYTGDPNAANKNQTHFMVSCSCDGGTTQRCGVDYVLFSDLTYLQSCTGGGSDQNDDNSLNINSQEECNTYCTTTNVFVGGEWNPEQKSCSCLDLRSVATVACDDTNAKFNDGSGLGDPCYENVGVTTVDCSEISSSASTPPMAPNTRKTLVSSTAIMGVWLLPW